MATKNWTLLSTTANNDTQLLQGGSGKEVALVSLIISNYSIAEATVEVAIYDSSSNKKAYIIPPCSVAIGDFLAMDNKLFLNAQDIIKVKSSQGNVSFMANGDES